MIINTKKNILKLFSFFLMSIFFINIVNSTNEVYFNSCDENYNGWTDNTTYILNFSEISTTYNKVNCFKIKNKNLNNITINSNKTIIIKKGITLFYFKESSLRNSIFNNITLNTNYNFGFINAQIINQGFNFQDNLFNNITIKETGLNTDTYFINGYEYYHGNINNYFKNNFNNINIYNFDYFFKFRSYQNHNSGTTRNRVYFNITNSLLIMNHFNTYSHNSRGYTYLYSNINVINTISTANYLDTGFTTKYYNSLFDKVNFTDDNDDNIADNDKSVGNIYIYNSRMYMKKNGYSFIQDFKEGKPFVTSNDLIFDIQDTNLTTNEAILGTNDNTTIIFNHDINLLNLKAISLTKKNNINCNNLIKPTSCYFDDLGAQGNLNLEFKPLISIFGNNNINNIIFNKVDSNNYNIIANDIEYPLNNVNIFNNALTKSDVIDFDNNYLINLWGSNINIYDNNITLAGANNLKIVGLRIKSENKFSNKITRNIFTNNNPNIMAYIFDNKTNTKFYENYIGKDILVTDNTYNSNSSNIVINPEVVYYNEDDDKFYYYVMGNYYKGFSNNETLCNDSDNDGFCNNAFISGYIIDEHPLSEYPFNFKNHLFTATRTINNNDFNITIYVPEAQNLVYDLNSPEDYLTFAFKQDSDYPDLICNYILNGVGRYSLSNVNNSIQTIQLNQFNEGYYTFYVECYNDYKYKSSEIYSFFVNYPNGQEPPENYTNSDGSGSGSGSGSGNGNSNDDEDVSFSPANYKLIDVNSVDKTSDNVLGFSSDLINGVSNLAIPVVMFFGGAVLILGIFRMIA